MEANEKLLCLEDDLSQYSPVENAMIINASRILRPDLCELEESETSVN